ncbi:MAG: glycogen-binding domain-containing protein [Phycisphaerales bacterium]|nr:MAG: glycogen-binding domain-containing protein [Phycisphaerales bacterium]
MKLGVSIGVVAVCTLAGTVVAQPYYLRGPFNGWSGTGTQLIDQGGGKFSATVGGLTVGSGFEVKATVDDWSFAGPSNEFDLPAGSVGNNFLQQVGASGSMTINFFPQTSWSDGWSPSATLRMGFEDPHAHGWDIMGSFDGWTNPQAVMTDLGNGLYKAIVSAAPGSYDFKFRKENDWGYAIGRTFENNGANAYGTVNPGDNALELYLDLPNGRWQANSIPTPGALALVGVGGLLAGVRRRR